MTSSIINFIIDKFLSNFVTIDPSQTKTSIFSGSLEISNLQIKPEIFSYINVPFFELVHGYIGKFTVKLSFPKFLVNPIKVKIEKVFFHARSKEITKLNKENEIKNMENYKNSKLQSAEELFSEVNKIKSESPSIATQMINNLQISVSDICIRFDDYISNPKCPFSFGMLMKDFYLRSTDEKFTIDLPEDAKIPYSEVNRKIIKLTNFSMFLDLFSTTEELDYKNFIIDNESTELAEEIRDKLGDDYDYFKYSLSEIYVNINNKDSHRYLLFNMNFLIKTAINDNLKNNHPKVMAEIDLGNIQIQISLEQIGTLMKFLAYINLNSMYQIGVAKEFYNHILTDNEKNNYTENYITYYDYTYTEGKKNKKESQKMKTILTQIENGLTYDQIQTMREAAMIKIHHFAEKDEIEKRINKLQGGSGFLSYFSSGPSEEEKKEIAILIEKQKKLNQSDDEIDKKIQEHLKKSEFSQEIDFLRDLNDKFLLYKFNLTLPVFSIGILENKFNMIEMIYTNFEIDAEILKKGQKFKMEIDDIKITQNLLKETNFLNIVETIEQKNDGINKNNNIENKEKSHGGAMSLTFINDPTFEKSDYKLIFRNKKRLIITCNLYSLQYLSNKILAVLSTSININEAKNYATGEISNYIQQGYLTNYVSGAFQHFNIELDVIIKSPIIIFPQNIIDNNNSSCMLIRFGTLHIQSKLPPRQILNKDYINNNDRTIMYDQYILKGLNFNMSTIEKFNGDWKSLWNIKGLNILDDVMMSFDFKNIIEQKNVTELENINISIGFPKIKFMLRDSQIVFFIGLLEGMNKINQKLEKEFKNLDKQMQINQMEYLKETVKFNDQQKKIEMLDKQGNALIEQEKKNINNNNNNNNNNIDNNNININNNIKKNFLLFSFKINSFEFTIMKKLSLTEHNLLQQIEDPVLKNKEYKDYLIFSMKKFFINFDMNNKKDMHASIMIGKMSISDAEFNYNKTEAPFGEPYQQFQFIMNTEKILNLEEVEETNVLNKSYQSSVFSDDDDGDNKKVVSKNIIIKNYNKEDEEDINEKFIDINYNLISAENKQIIDISFEKFKFCFPLTSLARLYQFYLYFFGLYLKSMTHTMQYKKKEIIDKERELIKQKILSGEIKVDDDENDNINVIKEENEDENEINTNVNNENKKPKKKLSYMERLKLANRKKKEEIEKEKKLQSKIDKYLQIQKKQSEKNLKIKQESSKIFVTFKMKEIDMDLPMEPLNKTTKILRFKFNFNATVSMENEFENTLIKDSITNIETITFTKYSKKNMNVTSKIFNIDFCLMDYNEGEAKMDNICNYLINNFRISVFLDSFLLLKDKEENSSNIMNVSIEFEPMMMNLGFVQLKYIMNYTEKLNLLLNEMNTPYDDPLKTYLINDNNIDDKNKKPLTFIETQILKSQILTYENIENLKNHMELTQALTSNNILNINNENEEDINKNDNNDDSIIPSNLDKMNNMMDIELTIDKICIRLLDNTIYNTTPLLKMEYNKISLKYIANSNPNSTENISNVIVESVSKKEIPFNEYKIYGLYQYVYLNFSVEIYFFNDGISDWEPILEKWGGEVKMLQVASFTKLKGEIISDDMCNMNLSLASVRAFNNALKKFFDKKETFFKKKSKDNLGLNESKIALEVINNTGLQIEFWLDADFKFNKIENKNVIKNKIAITEKAYTVNNNKLMHIYNKLDEIGLKLKKDKFSFRIKGYDAISGIDFSGNYFEGYLIKKPKREENENNNNNIINNNNNLINNNNIIDNNNIISESDNNLFNNNIIENDINIKSNNIIENDETEINTNSNNVLIKNLPNKIGNNNLMHNQSLIQNKLNLDDSIQIFLKIKQNGLMKSITLESNYCFKNNLNTDIILSFINPEDYKKKFLEEDKNIDHENNNLNRIIIQPGENKPIPLKFIMNHYRVYANLLSHKNINQKYVFLFKDFTFTQNNLKKYIEFDKSNGDEDHELENLDSIKVKFDDGAKNENEIVTDENNKNFIYAAVDFTIQRSANKSVSEISYKKNNFMSLYFYLFTFNYYSSIENQLPFDVKIINVNNNENYSIKPLQNFNIPNLNISENKFKISLKYFNKDYVSDEIDSNLLKNKPKTIKLFYISNSNIIDENAKEKFINITIKLDSENLNSNTFDPTLIKVIKNFSQRKKIILFFDYLIINKTNEDLFVGNSNLNDNDFNKFTDRFLVPSKNVSGFSEEKIDKMKFKNNLSSWSKETNVKTFGMTGVVNLEIKNEEDNKKNVVDEISVSITSSNYFTESIVINLEPRFVIVNKLGIDFKVIQYVKEKKKKR